MLGCGWPVLFILVLFLALGRSEAKATAVWIDTDVSIGSPFREVDDAFALVLAFRCSNLRIVGISSTYGNAPLRSTTAAARELVLKCGRESGTPAPIVFRGARSPNDLGLETDATRALAEAVRTHGDLVYIALGPLTNLATFEIRHPALVRRIGRVIFLGGKTESASLRFGSRHPLVIHDANVVKDPEAARRVMQTKIPLTLAPIATAAGLELTDADLELIGKSSEAGHALERKSRVWLWFWTKFVGMRGGPIFDAAAILAAAEPSQIPSRSRFAKVNAAGELIVSSEQTSEARRVRVCERLSTSANEFVRRKLSGTSR